MGNTPVYTLPAPALTNQADGPNGFQALADKIELTLLNLVRTFSQTLALTIWGNGVRTFSLSSVPLARPVHLTISTTARLPAGTQFLVFQLFDGATQVGVDQALAATHPSVPLVQPVTLAYNRVFTNVPVLTLTLGGSGTTQVDATSVSGLGFDWPS